MGIKLLWGGLTLIQASDIVPLPVVKVVGQVLMCIGAILFVLDK